MRGGVEGERFSSWVLEAAGQDHVTTSVQILFLVIPHEWLCTQTEVRSMRNLLPRSLTSLSRASSRILGRWHSYIHKDSTPMTKHLPLPTLPILPHWDMKLQHQFWWAQTYSFLAVSYKKYYQVCLCKSFGYRKNLRLIASFSFFFLKTYSEKFSESSN